MSEKRVKVEREVSEREIKVEREQILFNDVHVTGVLPEGTKEITENGDHDVYFYETARVNVAQPVGEITITENGTYNVKNYETAIVDLDVIILSDYLLTTIDTNHANILKVIKSLPDMTVSGTVNLSGFAQNATELDRLVIKGEAGATATDMSAIASGCSNLKYVEISGIETTSTTNFNTAFYNCTKLETVILRGLTIASAYTGNIFRMDSSLKMIVLDFNYVLTFSNYNTSMQSVPLNCLIYVPDTLVDSYKTASGWSARANYIKPLSELPANTGV